MTTRRFIVTAATEMVVNHVKNYGVPERGLGNLAWECVEGVVEKGERGSKSYFDNASDESLDGMHSEIQSAAELKLRQHGIALDA